MGPWLGRGEPMNVATFEGLGKVLGNHFLSRDIHFRLTIMILRPVASPK